MVRLGLRRIGAESWRVVEKRSQTRFSDPYDVDSLPLEGSGRFGRSAGIGDDRVVRFPRLGTGRNVAVAAGLH